MTAQILNLDLQEIFHYAEAGIRRAAIFSGLALNKKNTISINDLNIVDGFFLIPNNYDNDEIIKEYRLFTTKNALREMVELFEQTLIRLYEMLKITNNVKTSNELEKIPAKTKAFSKKSFPGKLIEVDALLNNKLSDQKEFWQSVQDIRNSITHYIGITHKEKIDITIPKFTSILKEKDTGKENILSFGDFIEPPRLTSEYELFLKVDYINKTFVHGALISFTDEEIVMLILGMKFSLDSLRKIILEHLIEKNIPIEDKTTNNLIKTVDELNSYINKTPQKEKAVP